MWHYTPEDKEKIDRMNNCECVKIQLDENGQPFVLDEEEWCEQCKEAAEIEERYSRANEQLYRSGIDYACGYHD